MSGLACQRHPMNFHFKDLVPYLVKYRIQKVKCSILKVKYNTLR